MYQKSTVPVPINGNKLGVIFRDKISVVDRLKGVYLKGYKVDYVWGNYTRRGIELWCTGTGPALSVRPLQVEILKTIFFYMVIKFSKIPFTSFTI